MKNGLAFGLGVLVGGGGAIVLANIILKQQYAQKADEEIAACREAFLAESAKRRKEQHEKEEAQKKEKAAEAIKAYSPDPEKGEKAAQVIWKAPAKDEKTKSWKAPYVIDPALFDAADNPNKCLGLKYYPKDGVITPADGTDEPMSLEDLDAAVGREALLHFGEYGEDDRVCVRNENWGVDYEICIQGRPWAEVLKEKPWLKK